MSYYCSLCNRIFASNEALQQHKQDAAAHTFTCERCNRSFGSQDALDQHIRDSPIHAASFDCESCNRSFGSQDALDQHIRDSPLHQDLPETPLNTFFRSFSTFSYDPCLSPAVSYANLSREQRWQHGDAASEDAWNRYQDALEQELHMWYGAESDLAAWHTLCCAIGVNPLPATCKRCKEAVRRTHVNIIDLIEWSRGYGNNQQRVQTFRNVEQLRAYTKHTRKIFRNTFDKESGNVVLRHLLRKIFLGNQ